MDDLRQDLVSPQLGVLLKTREDLVNELTKLNSSLSTAKLGKRAPIKRAIRNIEQQIKQIDKSIDKERNDLLRQEKIHNQEILANQGIDSRANMLQGISGIVGQSANLAGSVLGGGGLSAVGVAKQQRKGTEATAEASKDIQESKSTAMLGMSKNVMYALVAVVVILVLMFRKK